jgi:hypothetical protein
MKKLWGTSSLCKVTLNLGTALPLHEETDVLTSGLCRASLTSSLLQHPV